MNTDPTLFYFVNAEGSGHTRRAEAIIHYLKMPVVVATERPERCTLSAENLTVQKIPPLRITGDRQLADDVLHIPYGKNQAYLERVKTICDLCRHYQCSLAVIDVCVETAMIMRLCGIPYLYMRMNGQRDDSAHLQCYRAAAGLIASYPQIFEEDWVPEWMQAKTHYGGGIFAPPAPTQPGKILSKPYILVMRGKGMSQITPTAIISAAQYMPNYFWLGIGFDSKQKGDNFEILPYVQDSSAYLQQAEIIIANAGNNSVLEVGYWQKPLITIPEWRFFDEQTAKAAKLSDHNLAVVINNWPDTALKWRSLIKQAKMLSVHKWSSILSKKGSQRAANYINQQFTQFTTPSPIDEQNQQPQTMGVQ